VPMLFDSSKGEFNYADEGQSLDPRHFRGAIISFVDGHVLVVGGERCEGIILRKPTLKPKVAWNGSEPIWHFGKGEQRMANRSSPVNPAKLQVEPTARARPVQGNADAVA
jgi:prepilin-type processing-associated H-X9-DG protein